jgi:hypothetical protein
MLIDQEFSRLVTRCQALPPSADYSEDDYVTNLFLTVLDFMMDGATVQKAIDCYKTNLWDEIRTHADLSQPFARFPDDEPGNRALAQHLWCNNHWIRAALLRQLHRYFGQIGVTSQNALREWAETSDFRRHFEGRVRVKVEIKGKPQVFGLGYAVYQWLVIRQRVETIKPDVHVHSFVKSVIGRDLGDQEVVRLLEEVARRIGLKAYELDWRIWEYQRSLPPTP